MICDEVLTAEMEFYEAHRERMRVKEELRNQICYYFNTKYHKDPFVYIRPFDDEYLDIIVNVAELTEKEINSFLEVYQLEYTFNGEWFGSMKSYTFRYTPKKGD